MGLLFFNKLNLLISNMININKHNPSEQNSLWSSIIFKSSRRFLKPESLRIAGIGLKITNSTDRMTEFNSHFYHLGAMWPWKELLNISGLQLPHLSNGDNNNKRAYLIGLSWGLNELILVLCLELWSYPSFPSFLPTSTPLFSLSFPPVLSLIPSLSPPPTSIFVCWFLLGLVWFGLV